MSALHEALAEVGRLIEATPPHERKAEVETFLSALSNEHQLNFVTGVFIEAHATRTTRSFASVRNLTPEGLAGLLHAFSGTLGSVAYHPTGCGTCSAAWALADWLGIDVDGQPRNLFGMPAELRRAAHHLSEGAERLLDTARREQQS